MRFFFILSMGRSGTNMLSTLLDEIEGAIVRHEPHPEDAKLFGLRHARRFDRALDGMLARRFEEITPASDECEVYGEVNSYLRYEADWLRRHLDARVLFVCRDGRDFVRSAYPRADYTSEEGHMRIVPADDDPVSGRWGSLDRFERLCWYWAHTNEMLLETIGDPIRVESLLSSYVSFSEQVLRPLDLELPEPQWQALVSKPRNTSAQNNRMQMLRRLVRTGKRVKPPEIPRFTEWSDEMTDRFWSIAGDTMERLGYSDGS